MKKILFMFLLLIPFFVHAEYDESKITIESFNVSYKEGYGRETAPAVINGKNVNFYYEILNVGDKIVFDMVVKNESGEDVELYNRFDISDYVDYMLISPDLDYVVKNNTSKTFQLEIEYAVPVDEADLVSGSINDDYTFSLEVSNEIGRTEDPAHGIEDGGRTHDAVDPGSTNGTVDNPSTKVVFKDMLTIVCLLFVISIGLWLILRRRNRLGRLFIFIGIIGILTPVVVLAYKEIVISLKANVVIHEPTIIFPDDKNKDTVGKGDIVKIGNEEFYVIGHQGEDLVLLARYNLNVGDSYDSDGNKTTIESSIEGYGLQSSRAKGYLDDQHESYGVVAFSRVNYWSATTYPKTVYNSYSYLYWYVNSYRTYLENLGVSIKEARLLTKQEAIDNGCSAGPPTNCSRGPSYIKETSFWLGDAQTYNSIYYMGRLGDFGHFSYATANQFGIRPVIVLDYTGKETTNITYVCKRANMLHTETCDRTSDGCVASGYNTAGTITYGKFGTNGVLAPGDAFDCDVNGDGVYNPNTERFYYISNKNNVASLIYYNNVVNGVANNSTPVAYSEGITTGNGPITGVTHLPTISQWSNVSLSSTTRKIMDVESDDYTDVSFVTNFDYSGRAARLLTYEETISVCGVGSPFSYDYLNSCIYLLENTRFSNDNNKNYWIEDVLKTGEDYIQAHRVNGNNRRLGYEYGHSVEKTGVRPVIEVSLDRINY